MLFLVCRFVGGGLSLWCFSEGGGGIFFDDGGRARGDALTV